MCVSMHPAQFEGDDGTIVVFSAAWHPQLNRLVHVLVYQNTPQNLASGPNAMLLHFPAARPMAPENAVDTSRLPKIATNCVDAIRPPAPVFRGRGMLSFGAVAKGVHVFDSDIYTVVLAERPSDIPGALHRVPSERRPALNQAVFDWYAEFRPNWPMALCCFNNREAAQAKPMMWWYEPLDPTMGFLPAIDAHNGRPPDLEARVDVNHWAVFGLNLNQPGLVTGAQSAMIDRLSAVTYADRLDPLARALLPTHVMGRRFTGRMANGDFLVPVNAIGRGDLNDVTRGVLAA